MTRMGRPTSDPKTTVIRARVSDEDVKKLDYCCKIAEKNRSEIIRCGIEKVYNELKK